MTVVDGRRSPVAQVSETYATVIVAQRHGIAPQELADRLDANRRSTDEALADCPSDDRPPHRSVGRFTEIVIGVPDWELAAEVRRMLMRSAFGYWTRTGIVLDGRTNRDHAGWLWDELGPHGERRMNLFIFLLAIGIVGSVVSLATAQADHGNDADDRGPPCQRDVPLLTAAPSAPPAQAGRYLSQA